jgi:DICT domain-containing protein
MPSEPVPGVRGARIHAADPLRREWTVAIVSPHFAGALAAHDLGRGAPADRRFEFLLTYDRDRAVAAASALMARVSR